MGEVDATIFSISGGGDLRGGLRAPGPPAVVITHDADPFPLAPGGAGPLLSAAMQGSLSLAPSRSGSPRHTKVHPTERNKSQSSMAVFTTDSQLLGNDSQLDHTDLSTVTPHDNCWSGRARRTALGFFLTAFMCATWIGIIHLLKWATIFHLYCSSWRNCSSWTMFVDSSEGNQTVAKAEPFKAPFLTTWFFTSYNSFVFPIYLFTSFFSRRTRTTAKRSLTEARRRFREKGLTLVHFCTRAMFFCCLWVATSYMFIHAIGKLDATAVMALQASSASFVYLLSWVILHEQFVGIRIVAVILCNTGIALLAYMDGVSRTSTLGGVVLASAAAAGLAVHKVLFKKLIGRVTMGQLSIFLTLLGLLNVLFLWPICLMLYFLQSEVVVWAQVPYIQLGGSALLFLVANILGNFDIAHSYDIFLKLGVVAAVPVSAVLDVHLRNVVFEGMKLAGVLLISIGFMLVLLPDNWPDYITRLIRWRCRRCSKSTKPTDPTQPRARHLFNRPSS